MLALAPNRPQQPERGPVSMASKRLACKELSFKAAEPLAFSLHAARGLETLENELSLG